MLATALGSNLVATGIFSLPSEKARSGLYLINTATWTARVLSPRSLGFVSNGRILAAYAAPSSGPPFNAGLTLFDQNGGVIRHLYPGQSFGTVVLTSSLGYAIPQGITLLPPQAPDSVVWSTTRATRRLIFSALSGKPVTETLLSRTVNYGPQSIPPLIYPGSPRYTAR
jgi:hypothetical protein